MEQQPLGPSPVLASVADGVVVVGASAGGVEALAKFVSTLALDTRPAICVVLHVSPAGTSAMPQILARACRLPVHNPVDGEPLLGGHVYVAPPDHHLEVEVGRVRLTQSPRENGHRPAIDVTMRTASASYGAATVGVVLSGSRDDGTAGLLAIKSRGGRALVQDPDEALYPDMPRNAIAQVAVDAVLPLDAMGAWLARHGVDGPPDPGDSQMPGPPTPSVGSAPRADATGTRYTCPDCGGVLFEQDEGGLQRFRCSVGHVFSIESLSTAQAGQLEGALWTAVRALEDRGELLRHLADRSNVRGQRRAASSFREQANDLVGRAAIIREAIERSRVETGADAEAASRG